MTSPTATAIVTTAALWREYADPTDELPFETSTTAEREAALIEMGVALRCDRCGELVSQPDASSDVLQDEHRQGCPVQERPTTMTVPNGYTGDTVTLDLRPVQVDDASRLVQLREVDGYMVRWVRMADWLDAGGER